MEQLLIEWRKLEEKWKRNSIYDGKDESEWDKEYRNRERSKRTRRSLGMGGEPFPGESEMGQLSRGITEKDKKEKPNCGVGNPNHSKSDGRFVNAKDEAGSWSSGRWSGKSSKDCKKGQYRRPNASNEKRIVKKSCGRAHKSGGKAPYKCSTGEKLWEEDENGFIRVHRGQLTDLMLDEMKSIIHQIQEEQPTTEQTQHSRCPPGCQTYQEFLIAIDNLQRAQSGKLRARGKD